VPEPLSPPPIGVALRWTLLVDVDEPPLPSGTWPAVAPVFVALGPE
jgi:hypothetical protein